MKVTIYAPLLSRLLAGPRPYVGTLVGLVHGDQAHVLGCLLDHVEGGTPGVGSELLDALPGGLAPLGVAGDSDGRLEELALLSTVVSLLPAGARRAVVLSVSEGEGEPAEPTAAVFLYGDGELERTEFDTFSAEQLRQRTVLLRLEGALPLRCRTGTEPLCQAFERLERTLDSPAACFVQPEANRLLRAQGDDPALEGSCAQLAGRRSAGGAQALFRLMLQRTGLAESRPAVSAPVVEYARGRHQLVDMTLPLSCVALVAAAAPLAQAAAALCQAALRQLAQLRAVITDVYQEKERVVPAAPLHFCPEECGHYVTLVYSDASDDDKLESYRRNVHAALLLPADRPLFRRVNRHCFDDDSPFLTNVHVGLPPPRTAAAAQVALVRGTYVYHHYMQDRMDDSGWGCAYRSLQTLASWFQQQGYTSRTPPTHREIQQCLVDLGDKEASFVGSRQWIGSTEVSYCLQHLIGVESRILHVSNGADLGAKARALLRHFADEGTPVMIGGGVLAHTLLGIAFDEAGGEAAFLVLDPHYTGAENLSTIQNKGWCGWKDAQFWDQTAYYNLCMPIRPRCV